MDLFREYRQRVSPGPNGGDQEGGGLEPDIGLRGLYAVMELENSDEQQVHKGTNAHDIKLKYQLEKEGVFQHLQRYI